MTSGADHARASPRLLRDLVHAPPGGTTIPSSWARWVMRAGEASTLFW